jgi:hypothetical protein
MEDYVRTEGTNGREGKEGKEGAYHVHMRMYKIKMVYANRSPQVALRFRFRRPSPRASNKTMILPRASADSFSCWDDLQ